MKEDIINRVITDTKAACVVKVLFMLLANGGKTATWLEIEKAIIICDICGDELPLDTGVYIGAHINIVGAENSIQSIRAYEMNYDLCNFCSGKIRNFVETIKLQHEKA